MTGFKGPPGFVGRAGVKGEPSFRLLRPPPARVHALRLAGQKGDEGYKGERGPAGLPGPKGVRGFKGWQMLQVLELVLLHWFLLQLLTRFLSS